MQQLSPTYQHILLSCLPAGLSPDGQRAILKRYALILQKMLRGDATREECMAVERYMTRVAELSLAEIVRPGCGSAQFLKPTPINI